MGEHIAGSDACSRSDLIGSPKEQTTSLGRGFLVITGDLANR